MPCFKAANDGLTPKQVARVQDLGCERLVELWSQHRRKRFPYGLAGTDVNGICLVSLDSRIAGCVSSFLHRGAMDAERVQALRKSLRDLSTVIPDLRNDARRYFECLHEMTEILVGECDDAA